MSKLHPKVAALVRGAHGQNEKPSPAESRSRLVPVSDFSGPKPRSYGVFSSRMTPEYTALVTADYVLSQTYTVNEIVPRHWKPSRITKAQRHIQIDLSEDENDQFSFVFSELNTPKWGPIYRDARLDKNNIIQSLT